MNSSNAMKKGRFEAARLRGKDLNLRPLGYEPNELPLLHPAIYYKPEPSIVNGRKTVLGICGGRMVSGLLMTLEMTPKFNGIVRKRLLHDRKAGLKTQIAA